MRKYTVLLARPDNNEWLATRPVYLAHVEGETAEEALGKARDEMAGVDGWEVMLSADDLLTHKVLAVFEGHLLAVFEGHLNDPFAP